MRPLLFKRLLAALALTLACGAASSATKFTWGMCSHPEDGNVLWKDPITQLDTLALRGLTTYRFDLFLTSDARSSNSAAHLHNLVALAKARNITLHPILFAPFTTGDATDHGTYHATEEGLEKQGFNRVYPFVKQFAYDIHDWELQNEISFRQGVKISSDVGSIRSDYDTTLARQWTAVLRGMSRAVHQAAADTGQPLRAVVNFGYVDFGFITFLQAHGVVIDKLAYHYYYGNGTSPDKIYAPDGKAFDLFAEFRKFGKPVIINEFNSAEIYAPKRGLPYDNATALASFRRHLDFIRAQSQANIEGLEFYELYDEPWKDAAESNFGLMQDPTHAKTQMLVAALYACGLVRPGEQDTLAASGLFTRDEIAARLTACGLK